MNNNFEEYEKTTYSISEVCDILNCEAHILRYAEEKTGIDIERNQKGDRIYNQKDIDTCKFILEMKNKGLSYEIIGEVIKKQTETPVESTENSDNEDSIIPHSSSVTEFTYLLNKVLDDKLTPLHNEIKDIKDQNNTLLENYLQTKNELENIQEKHFRELDEKLTNWREENKKKKSLFQKIFKK